MEHEIRMVAEPLQREVDEGAHARRQQPSRRVIEEERMLGRWVRGEHRLQPSGAHVRRRDE
ncbi:MAG TPA: hypothetical protein VF814_05920 [Casimicrobiaceae bacterium]